MQLARGLNPKPFRHCYPSQSAFAFAFVVLVLHHNMLIVSAAGWQGHQDPAGCPTFTFPGSQCNAIARVVDSSRHRLAVLSTHEPWAFCMNIVSVQQVSMLRLHVTLSQLSHFCFRMLQCPVVHAVSVHHSIPHALMALLWVV
jgi:hypothetical protein